MLGCVGERWKSGVRGVSVSFGDWKGSLIRVKRHADSSPSQQLTVRRHLHSTVESSTDNHLHTSMKEWGSPPPVTPFIVGLLQGHPKHKVRPFRA